MIERRTRDLRLLGPFQRLELLQRHPQDIGKIGELVKDVVLAGNLFQTLDRIDHIAGDFTWNQMGGGCGKGGQFPLPVTEGAPHVRIEEALIGGDV